MNHHQQTGSELTVLDHVRSLRRTVFLVIFIILATASVVHYFQQAILRLLFVPLGETASELQFLAPLDPLYFVLKVDFTLGFLLSLPITIFLIWRFISPPHEHSSPLTPVLIIVASSTLGLIAAAYAYLLLVPIVLNFMSGLVMPGTALAFTADGYLSFLLMTTTLLILVFQIPLVIIGLTYAGLLDPNIIARNRRYVILSVVVATAFITPTTDPVSLALVSVPALAVVELGTILARVIHTRNQANTDTQSSTLMLVSTVIIVACLAGLIWLFTTETSLTLFSNTSVLE